MTGDDTLNLSLGELCTFVRGVTYEVHEASPTPSDSCLPILRAGNIADSLDLEHDLVWVPSTRVSNEQRLRGGDIVMCMSSGSAKVVGKSALVMTDWAGSAGAFCGILRPRSSVQAQWLAYWLRSVRFVQWRDSQARGANIQNLRFSQLSAVKLQVPSLKEQQRIVAKLDEQMAALGRAEKALAEQQAAALAFRRSTLQITLDPATHPDWRTVTVSQVYPGVAIGGTPPRGIATYFDGPFPWVSIADMNNNSLITDTREHLSESGIKNSNVKLVHAGSLLFSFKLTVGRVAFAGVDLYTNEAIAAFEPVSGIDLRYLRYALPFAADATTDSNTFGARMLNKEKILNLSISLPSIVEQRRVSSTLDTVSLYVDRVHESVTDRLELLQRLRSRLLDAAFAGEV